MTSNCLEKCGICYEEKEFNHFKILDCNHKVCKQCFPRIKNPLCPFCRQPFSSNRRSSLPISIPNSNNNTLDYLTLDLCSPNTSLNEVLVHKRIIETKDILGRSTEPLPFTPLIDVYDDGSLQKRIIIE